MPASSPTSSMYLLILLILPILTNATFVRRSDDDLYYSGGAKRVDYRTNKVFCDEIGGSVPAVHSAADVGNITAAVTEGDCVWVSGQLDSNGSYAWDDGTAFDYAPWLQKEPSCDSDCCAICIGTRETKADYNRLKSMSCSINDNVQVCRINMSDAESQQKLLAAWPKKFTESEKSQLSAYFFLEFVKEFAGIYEKIDKDESMLEMKLVELDASMQQVKDEVLNKSRENGDVVKQLGEKLEQQSASMIARIEQANNTLWESMENLDDVVSGKITALSEAIRETMESVDRRIAESRNETVVIVNDLTERVNNSIRRLDEKVEQYISSVNKSLEESYNHVNEVVTEVQGNLSQQIQSIDNKVENYTSIFDEQLRQQHSQELFDFLREQLEKNSIEIRDQREEINGLKSEVRVMKQLLAEATATTTEAPVEVTTTERSHKGKGYDWKKWIPSFGP